MFREEKGWGREEFTVWHILRLKYLQIRIHRMFEPEKQKFYHSHPQHFLSIIFKGKYQEVRFGEFETIRWRKIGDIGIRFKQNYHTVWHPHGKPSWSFVIFFGRKVNWNRKEI